MTAENVKVRLYLRKPNGELLKFFWFEVKDNDLYWGKQTKSSHVATMDNVLDAEGRHPFDRPVHHVSPPFASWKDSFHASGYVHSKSNGPSEHPLTYIPKGRWKRKEEITEPYWFYSLISQVIKTNINTIPKAKEKPAKHEYSLTLDIADHHLDQRLCMDCYLIPYWIPDPIILPPPGTNLSMDPIEMVYPMTDDYCIGFRFAFLFGLKEDEPGISFQASPPGEKR